MPPLRLLSEFLLDLNTTIIFDRESLTKVLLRIEESIYMEINQYVLSDVSIYRPL